MFVKQFESPIYGTYNAGLVIVVTEQLFKQISKRLNLSYDTVAEQVQKDMNESIEIGIQVPFHFELHKDDFTQAIYVPLEGMNDAWSAEGTGFKAWATIVGKEITDKFPVQIPKEAIDEFLLKYPELAPIKIEKESDLAEFYRPSTASLH